MVKTVNFSTPKRVQHQPQNQSAMMSIANFIMSKVQKEFIKEYTMKKIITKTITLEINKMKNLFFFWKIVLILSTDMNAKKLTSVLTRINNPRQNWLPNQNLNQPTKQVPFQMPSNQVHRPQHSKLMQIPTKPSNFNSYPHQLKYLDRQQSMDQYTLQTISKIYPYPHQMGVEQTIY